MADRVTPPDRISTRCGIGPTRSGRPRARPSRRRTKKTGHSGRCEPRPGCGQKGRCPTAVANPNAESASWAVPLDAAMRPADDFRTRPGERPPKDGARVEETWRLAYTAQ